MACGSFPDGTVSPCTGSRVLSTAPQGSPCLDFKYSSTLPIDSSLENSMHRGAWRAALRAGHKESDTTERLNTQASWLLTSCIHATVCDSVSLVCGNRSLKAAPARVSIPFIKPNSNFPVLTLVIRFPNGERKPDVQPSLCLLQTVLLLEVLLYLHSGSCLTGVRFPLHCPRLIDTKASCSHHD